jgi:diguanylate cyclase (GGDEF)-like protein
VDEDLGRAYWLAFARASDWLSLIITLSGSLYAAATWSTGVHRPILLTFCTAGLAASILSLATRPAHRLLSSRHRDLMFACWATGGMLMALIGIWVDGGLRSPLIWLLPLSVMITALVHHPPLVIWSGVIAVAGILTLELMGAGHEQPGSMLIHLLLLGAVVYVGVIGSQARWNLIEAQVENAARLAELAERDGLTGLLNHRAFHERLAQELAGAVRNHSALALLVIDLDRFKRINDTHGHLVGDAVLQAVTETIQGAARAGDVAARVGGEEFCLLLPATDLTGAQALGERIRSAVGDIERPSRITVSIGISVYPSDAMTAANLFDGADRAMYRAKGGGRNRVCVADAA